jgi:ribosomal protein S18 acetylase RimI-like enzyme
MLRIRNVRAAISSVSAGSLLERAPTSSPGRARRRPAGCSSSSPKHASERALGGAQLSDLQVAAPYRGTGLGRALLDAAEGSARDAGWDTIGLSVTVSNPDNELARSIYRRRGYRDSGQGEFHDGYHYHDAAGVRRYHGEQHVYLVKRLGGAGS